MLSGAGLLLVRWSIFSGPEVSLFFFIAWEIQIVFVFDPGLYLCYLQELCSFKVILTIEYKVLAGPINSS